MISLKKDLLFLLVAATTALCLGLLLNQLRDKSLPLFYLTKEQRLETVVESLADPLQFPAEGPKIQSLPDTLSLEEFSEFVNSKAGLVLDARPEIFHRLGHVPGAMSLAREDFENAYFGLRGMLDSHKTRPIIIYCSNASCEDSELVRKSLVALGFTQIAIFKGGWAEWTAAGKLVESGS